MAKLRDLIRGKPQRAQLSIPSLTDGDEMKFALRLLSGAETKLVEERARKTAGIIPPAVPRADDAIYQQAKMVERILLSAIDYEVEDKDEPFFANVSEVLAHLDDTRIMHVYQVQMAFQSKAAPAVDECDFEEAIKLTYASMEEAQKGGDPERPFVGLPYRKLTSYSAKLAGMLTTWTPLLSLLGSQTQPGTDDTKSLSNSSKNSEPKSSSEEMTPTAPSEPSTTSKPPSDVSE